MIPYPKELRARVVAAVEQSELTIAEVANLFSVSVAFVKKMLKLHRAGDDLEPRHGGGPEVLLKEKERELLRKEINKHPDATLGELQKVLAEKRNVKASLPTICRALQQLNLPRKKRGSSPMSVTKRNAASSSGLSPNSSAAISSLLTKWVVTLL